MNQAQKTCVGIAFSIFAFAPASSAGELGVLKKAPNKSQKLYVESSFGWRGGGRQNYNVTLGGWNDQPGDFSAGRWNETQYGTDLNLNLGYYLKEDLRISFGYKKVKQYIPVWYNGNYTGTNGDDHNVHIDAYVLNVYKDFPISDTRWAPYLGTGVGLSNVTRSYVNANKPAGTSSAPYAQAIIGISYSYEKTDIFGEISYGGAGLSDWPNQGTSNATIHTKSFRNIAGSFGIRIRL